MHKYSRKYKNIPKLETTFHEPFFGVFISNFGGNSGAIFVLFNAFEISITRKAVTILNF
jgi:hypothetical protein